MSNELAYSLIHPSTKSLLNSSRLKSFAAFKVDPRLNPNPVTATFISTHPYEREKPPLLG